MICRCVRSAGLSSRSGSSFFQVCNRTRSSTPQQRSLLGPQGHENNKQPVFAGPASLLPQPSCPGQLHLFSCLHFHVSPQHRALFRSAEPNATSRLSTCSSMQQNVMLTIFLFLWHTSMMPDQNPAVHCLPKHSIEKSSACTWPLKERVLAETTERPRRQVSNCDWPCSRLRYVSPVTFAHHWPPHILLRALQLVNMLP